MTELEQKASQAWSSMTRKPFILDAITGVQAMPVGVAIDFVQDVTGDRDDAVTALVNAGASWLDAQTRPSEVGEIADGCMADAESITSYLRGEALGMASIFLGHIRLRCESALHPNASREDRLAAHSWHLWTRKAQETIDWVRAVIDAAYPVEVKPN